MAACGGDEGGGGGDGSVVGLITKTDTNPFFVKMKEGAQQAADAAGVELQSFAGKQDGDNEAQVLAIESLISAGAAGFPERDLILFLAFCAILATLVLQGLHRQAPKVKW